MVHRQEAKAGKPVDDLEFTTGRRTQLAFVRDLRDERAYVGMHPPCLVQEETRFRRHRLVFPEKVPECGDSRAVGVATL